MNLFQNQPSTHSCRLQPSSSFTNKKLPPSSMEQAILLLKRQLRQCKVQREEEKQSHKIQLHKLTNDIDCLKRKIIEMKEKEYLKTVLNDDAEQQKLKQTSLTNNHKKLKLYAQKLQADIKQKDEQIQKLKQETMDLRNDKQMLVKQKQKHLQLSIIEKINLEERIQVLQKQIQSKNSLLNALRQQGEQTAGKQIQLKKLERKLVKKVNQVQHYEEQLKNFKQFQTQKLHTRIQALEKQNQFLKQHIAKIQQQFNSTNQCVCSNDQCKKEIDMFKNKYINKSRELSKARVELSKEIFKQNFLREIKNKENILSDTVAKPRTRTVTMHQETPFMASRHNQAQRTTSTKPNIQTSKVVFQHNEESGSFTNERTLPNNSLSKYKSQLLRRKQPKISDYR